MAPITFNGSPAAILGSTYNQTRTIIEALWAYTNEEIPEGLGDEYNHRLVADDLARIIMLNTEIGGRPYWTTVGQNVVESKESATLILDTGYQPFNASIVWGLADTELPAIRDVLWTQAGKPRTSRSLELSFAIPQLDDVEDTASSNLRRSASAERRASDVASDGARFVRPITPVNPMSDDDIDEDDNDQEQRGSSEDDLDWHGGLGYPPLPRRATSIASPRHPEEFQAPPLLHRMSPFRGERRAASPTPLDGDQRPAPSHRSSSRPSSSRQAHLSPSHHIRGRSRYSAYDSDDESLPQHGRQLPTEFLADDAEVEAIFAVETTASLTSLPAYAQPTARRAAALARKKEQKGGKEYVKSLLNGCSVALPYDVKVAIYDNKFWNLDKVNAFSQSSQPSASVPSGLEDLFVVAPSASRRCGSALEWQRAWSEVTKLVVRLYEFRREELDEYRDFFLAFIHQNEGSFDLYYSVDEDFRKHLGQPGYGFTLADATARFNFLLTQRAIQASRHRAPPSPNKPSSGSPKKAKASSSRGEAACRRWNIETDADALAAEVPPCRDPSKLLPGIPICSRKHVCSVCGGGHRAVDCSQGGGGGGGGKGGKVGGERGRTDGAPPFAARK